MTTNLQCIVYVSRATQVFRTEQLEGLLEESRRLNLQDGITGVLLYSDGNFMQYFEGTAPAMQRTYERIRQSRRHKDITELMDEPVAARNFPDWQMGLAEPSHSEMLSLTTARWGIRARVAGSAGSPSAGFALLQGFWRNARR